jgi:hypothetical protein
MRCRPPRNRRGGTDEIQLVTCARALLQGDMVLG